MVMLILTGMTRAEVSKAQNALDRDISLNIQNVPLVSVLKQIEDKASVRFVYSRNFVKLDNAVTIQVENKKLDEVLQDLLVPMQISYEAINDRIVLKKLKKSLADLEESMDEVQSVDGSLFELTVSGKITADTGEPLPGVNVLVKGTTNGTVSNASGEYTLKVNDGTEELVFSFIGYTTQTVGIAGRATVDVVLASDAATLEEIVVVGYGEQKKITVTGAVVAVAGTELQKSPSVNLSNAFAGRLAGVVAVQTSGEPGYDNSSIKIRGVNSIGDTEPLIVIDGIPGRDGGLNRLSPSDVESISVLKDASAAIYGSRAANGVILVTTKRGKSGVPRVTYDFNQGWAQPTQIPEMSNASEYAAIMNEIPIYKAIPANEWGTAWSSIQSTGTYDSPTTDVQTINANYSPTDVQLFKDGSDPWGHPDTDWFGDAFKTWSPQSRHNLQIDGGSENVKYMASVGYVYQDAYYKNSATNYKQYNMRVNLDAKINKYINTGLGIMLREEYRNFPTQSAGAIFRMLMRGRPTEPEVWPNGLPGPDIENGQNPYVVTTNATGYQKNPTDYLQTNGRIEFTNPWIAGLKLTLSASVDKKINQSKTWETPWYLYTWDKTSYESDGVTPKLTKALRSTFSDPRLTQNVTNRLDINTTAILNYDKTFGEHSIGGMVGVTKETSEGDFFQAYRRDYISVNIDQPFFGGTTQLISGGDDNRNTFNRARLGYYGRVTYNYSERYLAEFLWRVDGSSYFPPDKRFGFFPGILVGWNISNESFFSDNVKFFNFLKLRASYGQMGGDQLYDSDNPDTRRLIEYAYLSAYTPGEYPINSAVQKTLDENLVRNADFTWEVAHNSNIGLDGTILGNKVDFSFEYFFNRRTNMLIREFGSTPKSTGIAGILPPVNGGEMENKGFDFTLGYSGNVSGLTFRAGVNAGYNKNKIINQNEITAAPEYQWQTGKPYGAFLAYKSAGAFLSQAEIDAETLDYSAVTGTLLPGDMKIEDFNGDGIIDANDKVRLEKSDTPNFNYGITLTAEYKSFDLSILFQGAMGALLRFGTESGDIGNFTKYSHDNRWTIDNPSSTDPRLASRNDTWYTGGEFSNNTYFLFNKNYFRLKNIELGYNFPASLTSRVGLNNFRIYASGLNLITWNKYKIFDPEATNGAGSYYPQSRIMSVGLRLTF